MTARHLSIGTALTLALGLGAASTGAGGQPARDGSAAAVVRQWVEKVNALGDAPETIDAFVALHAPDALVTTGPTADQRGTATYRGPSGVRVFAERLAARETRRSYRLETETARESTASLLHETTGPWGGPAVAVQIVATYTDAASKVRFAAPGAVFFQIDGGRIRRARIYMGEGERAEVENEPTKKRP